MVYSRMTMDLMGQSLYHIRDMSLMCDAGDHMYMFDSTFPDSLQSTPVDVHAHILPPTTSRRIYGKQTTLKFGDLGGDCSGSSYYNRLDDIIVLQGKASVVTYLHEFAHVLGRDERGAVRWSVCLFKQVFSEEFAKCHFEGHMLRANTS